MHIISRSARIFGVLALCLCLIASQRAPATAAISGKTWTCIILCGGALVYYVTKLSIDNSHADTAGHYADALIDQNWVPGPTGVASDMRYLRGEIIESIWAKYDPSASTSPPRMPPSVRAQYESLRTCWNSFVYGGPPKSDSSETKPDDKGVAAPSDATTTTQSTGSCTTDKSGALLASRKSSIDVTDVGTAFSTGPSLVQEIENLNVLPSLDVNELRAAYLYYLADAFYNSLNGNGTGAKTTGAPPGAADLLTNCDVSLDAIKCITSLGALEGQYASDTRKDVACDVARRAQLPMVTTIKRVMAKQALSIEDDAKTNFQPVETPLEGSGYNFGAVPGC